MTGPSLAWSDGKASAYSTTGVTSGSFTPSVGDIIVVKGITENYGQGYSGNPTSSAGNLSFGSPKVSDASTSGYTCNYIWTAVVGAGQDVAMTISTSGTSGAASYHSAVFECWHDAKLDATPATCDTRGSGAPSTTITTEANNSVVTWSVGDWSAVAGSSTYANGSAVEYDTQTTNYYAAHYTYQTAATAGSQTLSMTAPTGQKYTILGIEIQENVSGQNFTQTPADDAGLTDSVSFSFSKTDSAGLTDTPAKDMEWHASDDAGLTDSVTLFKALTQTPADDAGLTDAVITDPRPQPGWFLSREIVLGG